MSVLGVAVFIGILLAIAERRERNELFRDQPCGYCPMNMHWDRRKHHWVHENGEQFARTPRTQTAVHRAVPYGIVEL
jgi:hypothetical protein